MGIFKSKKKKAAELFETGAKGAGTLISVKDTGMTVNDNPRVKMTFRVEPLDGSPAFDASKTTTVPRVEIPRQGDRYPVWYDQQDPSKLGLRDDRQRPGSRNDAPALWRCRGQLRRDGRSAAGALTLTRPSPDLPRASCVIPPCYRTHRPMCPDVPQRGTDGMSGAGWDA